MKPRVVITGVAGFIGSNLADRLLQEGYRVVGIDDLSYGIREQIPHGVMFHLLDIRSPQLAEFIEPGDVIFHLAAKNCIADCQKDPIETADINVTGTVVLFEAARQKKARKVIYAESSALYEGISKLPTPEHSVKPESFYAVSKLAGMVFAEAYQRFYHLKMTALRYFCVYGPRQDYRRTIPPVMSAFIIKLLRGERPTIYGSGQKSRDFIYVDDVNDFHVQCINDSRTDGQVYNLGSGSNYSVVDVFNKIESILKTELKPTYQADLPGEAGATLADITAARALGWQPNISLEEGLLRSVEYIKTKVLPQLK